jgi:hypothetical protein
MFAQAPANIYVINNSTSKQYAEPQNDLIEAKNGSILGDISPECQYRGRQYPRSFSA